MMNQKRYDISALSILAHSVLNDGGSEYARNKAIISQFFRSSCAVEYKEEVRLILIDSLYSTNVAAKRLFGIGDIAEKLRRTFANDAGLKKNASQWIESGFDDGSPLYDLFAEDYGIDKSGEVGKGAYSLLSKYLYFATDYAFPIYDALGAKHYYLAKKKNVLNFQARFRILQEIMRKYGVDSFDSLDNFFWLYGKISAGSLSLVLNKAKYIELMRNAGERSIADIVNAIRTRKDATALRAIIGAALYEFIQKTALMGKE
ncbi:MAG: hypothetical protein LBQ57_14240 [Spirochaetales bacterium]|jgi:hypothetical protein|nr:hypothetical protein [Spirochaetales bacterium]